VPARGGAALDRLAIDPVTGVFYGATATNLTSSIQPPGQHLGRGVRTTTMIAIAVNADGQMYGHDITSDSIYRSTPHRAATLIG